MYELQAGPSAKTTFIHVIFVQGPCLHFSMGFLTFRYIPPNFRYSLGTSAVIGGIKAESVLFNITLKLFLALIYLASGFGHVIL